jgi:hypothetical protein
MVKKLPVLPSSPQLVRATPKCSATLHNAVLQAIQYHFNENRQDKKRRLKEATVGIERNVLAQVDE